MHVEHWGHLWSILSDSLVSPELAWVDFWIIIVSSCLIEMPKPNLCFKGSRPRREKWLWYHRKDLQQLWGAMSSLFNLVKFMESYGVQQGSWTSWWRISFGQSGAPWWPRGECFSKFSIHKMECPKSVLRIVRPWGIPCCAWRRGRSHLFQGNHALALATIGILKITTKEILWYHVRVPHEHSGHI